MQHLSIDIETFSSIDLKKSGLYKYVQSPDFAILLFAFSLDGAPVNVVDIANGEQIPTEIARLVFDESTIKHAYNAAFEWYCLCKYFRVEKPENFLKQWHCTMLHGLYCGGAAGLSIAGEALGIPADKQKLGTGKALIRTFCSPVKSSAANGNRTRNLPCHEPEKWELFKEYCRQDVVAEIEILRRLSAFPVPKKVREEWALNEVINLRGVCLDMELVGGALGLSAETTEQLTAEAISLCGLQNPNSVAQLAKWLSKELDEEVSNLQKATVSDLLDGKMTSESARRVLEIRQELSKTSVKKYTAMRETVCEDGRARGLMQFYGANRTGRWAGRLIQVQNLPRTYIPALSAARNLVKEKRRRDLQILFGSVPGTLSQLIRTALVPAAGKVFIDADFSAIEARVIAWLAGEEWVLEVFRTHGRIYEAAASQMFGIPLELIKKGRPEYAYRQRGKVATLALGFGGGAPALISQGALKMGLSEEELPEIVTKWRHANPRIVDLWRAVENAAIATVKYGSPIGCQGLIFSLEKGFESQTFLTILLPSGRKLFYVNPFLAVNKWGRDSVFYYGVNNAGWQTIGTYGGKLVENIVQAIARDCLSESITRLESAGYPIVFHVHDEVIIEAKAEFDSLEKVCKIMSEPVPWAEGLPLAAEGWVGEFYTKD